MAKLRRPLFRDLLDVQDRMNRLFDDLFVQNQEVGLMAGRWSPAVDIYETETAIVVLAEVPGTEEEDLEIEISDNVLTLRGNRKPEPDRAEESINCLERGHGPFMRSFTLPCKVKQEQARASLKQGLLKVVLPKEKILSREVTIETK